MGGLLPHMVPHSAVCALHLIAVALGLGARRSHSPGHSNVFYSSNVEVQEEAGTTLYLRHRFMQNSCFLVHQHRFSTINRSDDIIYYTFFYPFAHAFFN